MFEEDTTHAWLAGSAPAAAYQEARSALTWPLLTLGLFVPGAGVAACAVLAAAASPVWLLGVLLIPLLPPFLISISLLYRNWPTGIRLDTSGITIGAIRSPRARRRTPTVTHQSWGLFSCPWSQVRAARVVTDPAELRRLKAAPLYATLTNRWGTRRPGSPGTMTGCKLGVLTAPFMRAALVVDLDLGMAETSQIRPARYFGNGIGGSLSRLVRPEAGTTWIVPTRRPGDLAQALGISGNEQAHGQGHRRNAGHGRGHQPAGRSRRRGR